MFHHLMVFNQRDMKNMILALVVFGVGCGGWSDKVSVKYKKYDFVLATITSDFDKERAFQVPLPKGGNKKEHYPQHGRVYVEYRVSYPDNSVFYLSNDIWNGSRLNVENLIGIGINGHTKEAPLDTVSYSGGEKLFWKEQFIGDIVVGYVNASSARKDEFEAAIRNMTDE